VPTSLGGKDWRIIHGDCLEVLRTLPDASVDAVITDPPYNVGFRYRKGGDRRADYRNWCQEWFHELLRVRPAGPILISCGVANLATWLAISQPRWVLCWWKPAAMGRCTVGFNNWEPVLLYGTGPRKKGCDVIRACIRPDSALNSHPCPKPLEWAAKQVEMFTKEGDTVLDPFAGSGTVGAACLGTGRNFIGIEVDTTYCKLIRRRLGKHTASAGGCA
jgi:DNA modification methylase